MSRLKTMQEEQDFEAYIQALFSLSDHNMIHDKLSDLAIPAPFRLRIKVLYSKSSVKDIIDKEVGKGTVQNLNKDSSTYLFDTAVGRLRTRRVRIPFILSSFKDKNLPDNIQAIISVCKSDPWKALMKISKKTYPRLVPILLSQAELIQSAKRLKKITAHSVNVRAYSAKESFNEKKKGYKKSLRIWTDEDLDNALLSIRDRRQIVTSIDVEFFHKIGSQTHILPSVICKIRKDGEIEVSGSYKLAFDSVVSQIAEVGERKLRFFSGRGLQVANYQPRPLALNFGYPVFDKLDTIRHFVTLLSKYPSSMHAILHGNPYAHVKITDIFDGSSFDVWAISPFRIALMPGLKASEASFERLVHYIFDKFREGNIADYDNEGRKLESVA